MCFRTEETIHPLQDRLSHSDFISINVTSASRFARGDRTLLRHILFSSHYMDIFKNIQNATQIRCVMRLQNSLFTAKNVKVAVDKAFVVWQAPFLHSKSWSSDTPSGFLLGYTGLESTLA